MNVFVVVLACIGSFILGRYSMRLVMDQRLEQGRKELAEKRERLMALRDELMGIADDLSNKESALKQMRQKLESDTRDLIVRASQFNAALSEENGHRTDRWTDEDDRYLEMWRQHEQPR